MDKIKFQKVEKIQVKMTSRELSTLRELAERYSQGNVSRWIRFAAIEMGHHMMRRKK